MVVAPSGLLLWWGNMRTNLLSHDGKSWSLKGDRLDNPDLVLAFLSPSLENMTAEFDVLRSSFPSSIVVGCTTSGEIFEDDVRDESAAGIALSFDKDSSRVQLARGTQTDADSSFETGARLATELQGDDLAGVFIISDGLLVNGSQLILGLQSVFDHKVIINGGLAGDNADFATTLVGANNTMTSGQIAIIGFYGTSLKLHSSSFAGWDDFGHVRTITRAKDNVLYELNDRPALDIYKKYLGEEADNLPGSALLYPLNIYHVDEPEHEIIRSVIGINEEDKSLIFAGDIPEGYKARLMVGSPDNLIAGAGRAAQDIARYDPENAVALLVSCVGRFLVLGQRSYEEAEEVSEVLGAIPQVGFYSYGEISPHHRTGRCDLHNQTMTITVVEELAVEEAA